MSTFAERCLLRSHGSCMCGLRRPATSPLRPAPLCALQAARLAPGMAPQQLAEVLSCQACCSYATEAELLAPLVSNLWLSLVGVGR